jgi:hypothetical protein
VLFDTVHFNVTEFPAVKPVIPVVALVGVVIVAPFAAPTTVHKPVAGLVGTLPDKVNEPSLHLVWSILALAVTLALFVKTTSSLEEHVPFVTVHLNVTELPAVKPVMPVVALVGVVIVAPFAAPTIAQTPLPTEGVLPAKVNEPLLHCVWSTFAVAVTVALFVKTTSSFDEQVPFDTVHFKVTELPAVRPVIPVVALVGVVIVAPFAAPTIVHKPVAGLVGILPAKVNAPLLHWDWSTLAFAVTLELFVKTTSSLDEHVPLDNVHFNVTELPAVKPVIPVVALVGVVIAAPFAAPTIVHKPVAGLVGTLPAKVNAPLLHWVWSTFALAVTLELFVKTTSSFDEHVPLDTVHFKVTELPAVRPVIPVVALVGVVIVAPFAEPTIVHNPVAGLVGTLPAKVNAPLLHWD